MMTESTPWRERLLAMCAPALLVLVAAVHLYLVESKGLSPWKGGGFGMFSTVDSPSARFLRVYLVEGASEVQVRLPDRMKELGYDVRVLPTHDALEGLATRVANGTWVPERLASAVTRYQALLAEGVEQAPGGSEVGRVDFMGVRLLRMLEPGEPPPPLGRAHVFQRVRVELWTFRFEPSSARLVATRLAEASAEVPP
ncbi:hypothetical protein [Myxococcus landrumensis]|uniref:Lipoprotein n=1 Tax=Myxococcus landrumensis TaxID=2813577 RepID=A0ABX7N0W8_9BACT|nr:hypothetical protein [Myxococcus landrumus]QSQ12350.1 hypothetical protein JY572_28860 [Myxococcus landrumus]